MTTRFLPYATTPHRLLFQLVSDIVVACWTTVWVFVAMSVHAAIATIADVGRQVNDGSNGLAHNLDSAGDRADDIPIIGDSLRKPLEAAGDAARDVAGAGHTLDTTAGWLSWLLAIAVAAPPIMAIAMPWLLLRVRFFLRKWSTVALTRTPAGEQLLALRALAKRPLRKLVSVDVDPVGAWRREEALAIRGLATLELRAAGIGAPRAWR